MNKLKEIYDNLDKIENLPAFPGIAFEVLKITRDDTAQISSLEKIIKKDPNIVSQILKIVNSPFYNLPREVSSLSYAINLLGFIEVENLVMVSVMLSTLKKLPVHKRFDRDKFLEHSFGCGITAKTIAGILNINFFGAEFTGGVIHDIGKVLIDLYAPEALDNILENAYTKNISFIDSENELYEINHTQLGKKLLSIWGLPKDMLDIVRYHHSPKHADNDVLVSIVHVADLLTYSEGIGFGGNYAKFMLEDDEGWKILLDKINMSKTLDLALFTFKLYEDIEEQKKLYL